jgi:hypothetical protein
MKRLAAFALLCALVSPAFAWGPDGHRITGLVADQLLTAKARIHANRLMRVLQVADLAELTNMMDVFRPALSLEIPKSEKWHYDNQPLCAAQRYEQYCADGHCASSRIPHFFEALADTKDSETNRARALMFLVHMVGDIHQPLHAADDDDWGGNKKHVLAPGASMPSNLHRFWDIDAVRLALRGISERDYAAQLLARYRPREVAQWQAGEARDWMAESFALARDVVYGKLPEYRCGEAWPMDKVVALPREYGAAAAAIVPEQLAKAGARIAWLLNRALDGVNP